MAFTFYDPKNASTSVFSSKNLGGSMYRLPGADMYGVGAAARGATEAADNTLGFFSKGNYGDFFDASVLNPVTNAFNKQAKGDAGGLIKGLYSSGQDPFIASLSGALKDGSKAASIFGSASAPKNIFKAGTDKFVDEWMYQNKDKFSLSETDPTLRRLEALGKYYFTPDSSVANRSILAGQGNSLTNTFSGDQVKNAGKLWGDGLYSELPGGQLSQDQLRIGDIFGSKAMDIANRLVAASNKLSPAENYIASISKATGIDPTLVALSTIGYRVAGGVGATPGLANSDKIGIGAMIGDPNWMKNFGGFDAFYNSGVSDAVKKYLSANAGVLTLPSGNENIQGLAALMDYMTAGKYAGRTLDTSVIGTGVADRNKAISDWRSAITKNGWGNFDANNRFAGSNWGALGADLAAKGMDTQTVADILGWGKSELEQAATSGNLNPYVDLVGGKFVADPAVAQAAAAKEATNKAIRDALFANHAGSYTAGGGFELGANTEAAGLAAQAAINNGWNINDLASATGRNDIASFLRGFNPALQIDSSGKLMLPSGTSFSTNPDGTLAITKPVTSTPLTLSALQTALINSGGAALNTSTSKPGVADLGKIVEYAMNNGAKLSDIASALGVNTSALTAGLDTSKYALAAGGDKIIKAAPVSYGSSGPVMTASAASDYQSIINNLMAQIANQQASGSQRYSRFQRPGARSGNWGSVTSRRAGGWGAYL